MYKKKTKSILRVWTNIYVVTLAIGLLLLLCIALLWLRYSDTKQQESMLALTLDFTINSLQDDAPIRPPNLPNSDVRPINPLLFITNRDGEVVSMNRPNGERFLDIVPLWLKEEATSPQFEGQRYLVMQRAITQNDDVVGYVLAVEPKKSLWTLIEDAKLIVLLLTIVGLLGWLAIYMVTKRLSKPILQVAEAAKEIGAGNYEVTLSTEYREEEIVVLMQSFEQMTLKLSQLERTRTELLAGVTHELKTPITSVAGLLQAVKDGVVTGAQAQTFLQMATDEMDKMKRMVGDLLTFNAYAVDAVPVELTTGSVSTLLEQSLERFRLTHQLTYSFDSLDTPIVYDNVRLQQVVENIVKNACEAANPCHIHVSMSAQLEDVIIAIQDNGSGIAAADQPYIFERFYRGEQKKYAVRGLGLGLALSKMMMQSMEGDLCLAETSEAGTTFHLRCKRVLSDVKDIK